jgi:hypothetical protein
MKGFPLCVGAGDGRGASGRIGIVLATCLAIHCLAATKFASSARADDVVTVFNRTVARINPQVYGINYDWIAVPAAEYDAYIREMRNVTHFTLQVFPAGWDAENYDWNANDTPRWFRRPIVPGADADLIIETSPAVAFILPSRDAVGNPRYVPEEVGKSLSVVRISLNRVRIWEIGNEWWLQSGARRYPVIRQRHLLAYAEYVAALVPNIIALEPQAEIYVTGDWLRPEEFAVMRQVVGEATWSRIKGIALHPYCRIDDPEIACARVPQNLAAVRSITGKSDIFASEWNVTRAHGYVISGMDHANEIGIELGRMVASGVDLAAYWPAVKIVRAFALVTSDYRRPEAAGLLFGWLARYYRGLALETGGSVPALAAVTKTALNVFVFSENRPRRTMTVMLPPSLHVRNTTARAMYAVSPNGMGEPMIAQLPVAAKSGAGGTRVGFVLNPGIAGRGSAWEIAHITFRLSP